MLIYLSYRIGDSFSISELFKTHIIEHFGKHRLVMDAANRLPIGISTTGHIRETVSYCDLMIVLIGPEWAVDGETGQQHRLNSMDDVVRIEVEAALRHHLPIVPVLSKGATVPSPELLPESMHGLYYYDFQYISPKYLERDIHALLKQCTEPPYKQAIKNFFTWNTVRRIVVFPRNALLGLFRELSAIASDVKIALSDLLRWLWGRILGALDDVIPISLAVIMLITLCGILTLIVPLLNTREIVHQQLAKLEPSTAQDIEPLASFSSTIKKFAFNPTDAEVAVIGETDEVSLWDYTTGNTVGVLSGRAYHDLVYNPNGLSLFLMPVGSSSVIEYSLHTGSITTVSDADSFGQILMFNAVGNLMETSETPLLSILSKVFVCAGCTPLDMVVDVEKDIVYYLYQDNWQTRIAAVSPRGGVQSVIEVPLNAEYIDVNPDGSLIVAGNASQMVFWTTTDWQVSAIVSSDGDPIVDVQFGPQGDLLAVLDSSGMLTLWGVED